MVNPTQSWGTGAIGGGFLEKADRMSRLSEEDGGRAFWVERTAHVEVQRGKRERCPRGSEIIL